MMLASGSLLVLAAACGSPSTHSSAQPPPRSTAPPVTTTSAAPPPPPTAPVDTAAPGWAVLNRDVAGIAAEERLVTGPSGRQVTLVRFRTGHVVFDLHVGSSDPPTDLAAIPPDRGPSIAADEAPFLLAAFNGGFKMNANQGGFEVQGQVLYPLVPGLASFVIDTDGAAHIGVWGSGLPVPKEQVASVRQNLPPLITDGVVNPTVGKPAAWGAAVSKDFIVARSAAGEDAFGNIVYAGGMALLPQDLSDALLSAGVVNGMQLDINPNWIQLDAAPGMGATLAGQVPGQHRPADQYVVGWTRDFFAVMGLRTIEPAPRPR
jgi:hypothetical protein